MITADDLSFNFVISLSSDKEHALLYSDHIHHVKKEVITKGRTIGGMFKPGKQKTYFYRDEKGSVVHESIDELLKELNS